MKLNRIFFPLVAVGLMAMSCSAEFEHGVNDIDSWPLSGANYEPSLEYFIHRKTLIIFARW